MVVITGMESPDSSFFGEAAVMVALEHVVLREFCFSGFEIIDTRLCVEGLAPARSRIIWAGAPLWR
jgi:hypothetical protein